MENQNKKLNQCDGCQRGNHGTGLSEISCTKDKYSAEDPVYNEFTIEKPEVDNETIIQDWKEDFKNFYWEIEAYSNRPLGIQQYISFIEKVRNQALEEQKEQILKIAVQFMDEVDYENFKIEVITKIKQTI